MDMKLENGDFACGPGGIPLSVCGEEELLQNIRMALEMKRGSLPYNSDLGSGLKEMAVRDRHREERALALASEGLRSFPGIVPCKALFSDTGILFTLSTPRGPKEIFATLWTEGEKDGQL